MATVKVNLRGTFGYSERPGQAKTYYGPGEGIEVPEALARSLGLTPLAEQGQAEQAAPAVEPKPRQRRTSPAPEEQSHAESDA